MPEPVVGIVGGGALGLIYGARLAIGGAFSGPVLLVSRQEELQRAPVIKVDFLFSDPPQSCELNPDRLRVIASAEANAASCDYVILLSRSYESAYAVAQAKAMLKPSGYAVTLQNGLSGWDELRRSGLPYLAGVAFVGGHRAAGNIAKCSRIGHTVIGSRPDALSRAKEFCALLSNSGMPCVIGRDEASVLWRKLLITAVNWICASLGAPAGELISAPRARELILDVLRELMPIAAADGAQLQWDEQVADLDQFIKEGRRAVGSAYEALRQGQRLEVIEICESVLARAERYGIEAKLTDFLLGLLDIQSSLFTRERERWMQR